MRKLGKFSVLVILGMLLGMSVLPGQVVAGEIEVIITQEDGMECALVTFEGNIDWTGVGYIPAIGMDFSPNFVTLTNGPWINIPSPNTAGFWLEIDNTEIFFSYSDASHTFDEPICAISFYYAGVSDITLEVFDENENTLASITGPSNFQGGDVLDVWDLISIDIGQNIITKARLSGIPMRVFIDDLKVCRIVSPEVAIENLIDDIENMELNGGNANSFLSKLDNILMLLENGNDDVAINLLEALINAIEAQRGNKLTDEEADALIEAAQNIIDYINNNLT